MAVNQYKVTYQGKAAHAAAAPNSGQNALLAACVAVQNLYAISRHSNGVTRVNVGLFKAENSVNVIAEEAIFGFEVRGTTNESCHYMNECALKIIEKTAEMYNVAFKIEQEGHLIAAKSSLNLMKTAYKIASKKVKSIKNIIEKKEFLASEDVAFFMERVQKNEGESLFVMIGAGEKAQLHTNFFDIDEEVLLVAAEWFIEIFLQSK